MKREDYIHVLQDAAFESYRDGVIFQKDVEKVYEDTDYMERLPDLLGKTVRVSEKQFPEVNALVKEMCEKASDQQIPVYVYEEYYYGAESYGINKPWIEISAKTIADFTEGELRFVLAREIYKISDGVTRQKTMMEERFKYIKAITPGGVEEASRIAFNHWYRLANYTADNYGYIFCGSIKSSVNAVLKMVLNSISLSEQVDIKEFTGQASEINKLDGVMANHAKADEPVPYAPHRIQNLLAYAESKRGLKMRIERMG